jgi:signal recognition particle subunit SRP54
MGSVKELMGMIPGMDKAMKGVEISDDAFKPIEAMINSMTPAERANPSLLNGSRKNRIAKGAGVTIVDLNRFLKQFDQTAKMMKKVQQMSGKRR